MTAHSAPAAPGPASAPYDFDTPVDRRGTWCTQWDYVQDRFGVPDLLPFTISDMDFETAPEVLAALRGRLEHGVLGYSRWRQDDFLSAIVHWYAARHGTAVDPGSVVYAPSVVYQVSRLLHLWSRPGDGVVAHTPMYDAFPRTVAASGRRLLECPLDDWPELERLLALPDTAVLLLCSPHNPTGRVWSAAELDRMARLCARHGVAVVSDEIHSDLAHAPHLHRPWVRHAGDGRWAVVTSASKSFNIPALTGSYGIIGDPASRDAYLRQLKDADGLSSPRCCRWSATSPRTARGRPGWTRCGRISLATSRWSPTASGRRSRGSTGGPRRRVTWRGSTCVRWASTTRSCNANWWRSRRWRSCPGPPTAPRGRVRLNVGCPRSKAEAGVEALVRALGRLTGTQRR